MILVATNLKGKKMIKIKFRLWDKGTELHRQRMINFEEVLKTQTLTTLFGDKKSNRFEILLYTGLKDKNDNEIYEGDILEVYNQSESKLHFKGIVVWCDKYAKFVLKLNDYEELGCKPYADFWEICDCSYNIYIKGNIYENKNLLKF